MSKFLSENSDLFIFIIIIREHRFANSCMGDSLLHTEQEKDAVFLQECELTWRQYFYGADAGIFGCNAARAAEQR